MKTKALRKFRKRYDARRNEDNTLWIVTNKRNGSTFTKPNTISVLLKVFSVMLTPWRFKRWMDRVDARLMLVRNRLLIQLRYERERLSKSLNS